MESNPDKGIVDNSWVYSNVDIRVPFPGDSLMVFIYRRVSIKCVMILLMNFSDCAEEIVFRFG